MYLLQQMLCLRVVQEHKARLGSQRQHKRRPSQTNRKKAMMSTLSRNHRITQNHLVGVQTNRAGNKLTEFRVNC